MDYSIEQIAKKLALKFEVDTDIPDRLKPGSLKVSSDRIPDSQVEKRFQKHIDDWIETINSILHSISDQDQAWRFIRTAPKMIDNIRYLDQCDDFKVFTNFFIQRRDIDLCGPNELGNLARLHLAFQRKIESRINKFK